MIDVRATICRFEIATFSAVSTAYFHNCDILFNISDNKSGIKKKKEDIMQNSLSLKMDYLTILGFLFFLFFY